MAVPQLGTGTRFPVHLTAQERRTIHAALHLAAEVQDAMRYPGGAAARELADRIAPITEADQSRDLTRSQECAADAMAAIYGRSAVRHQGDGSVVITGLTDDVERETVCVEIDGRERWRR